MRDRVCPIGDCTATVRFDSVVVDVTPRYRLHDLDEVDEFAVCPGCDAEIAGYYEENEPADDGDVELILDIDDENGDEAGADGDEAGADGDEVGADGDVDSDDDGAGGFDEAVDGGGDGVASDDFDVPGDDFDDPAAVLDEASETTGVGGDDGDGSDSSDGSAGSDDDDERVFGSTDDE